MKNKIICMKAHCNVRTSGFFQVARVVIYEILFICVFYIIL